MRNLKYIGLAVFAALAITAFVGAGTASATTLCKVESTPNACSSPYLAGQVFSGTATNPVLTNPINNVKCSSSATSLKQTSNGGGTGVPVTGTIESLSFSGCALESFPFSACKSPSQASGTIKTDNLPYKATVTYTSLMNGTLVASSDGNGEPSAHVECGSIINCIFGASEVDLGISGGKTPTITAKAVLNLTKQEGFICPTSSTWDATYAASPAPIYVSPN